jgi:hypothetical protein
MNNLRPVKKNTQTRRTHKTITPLAGALGVPAAATRAAEKLINAVGNVGRSNKKKRNRRNGTRETVGSVPANVNMIVDTENTRPESFKSTYLIIGSCSRGTDEDDTSYFFALVPWENARDSNMNDSWDPKLLNEYPKWFQFRVDSAVLRYLGSAGSVNPVDIFMGTTDSAVAPSPNTQDYSALPRSKKISGTHTGAALVLLHDREWHEIDDSITHLSSPTNVQRITHWPGRAFIHITGAQAGFDALRAKFQLDIKFSFRARNPAFDIPQMISFSGASDAAGFTNRLAISPSSLGKVSGGTNNQIALKGGYLLVHFHGVAQGTTATTAGEVVVRVLDVSANDVTGARCLGGFYSGVLTATDAFITVGNAVTGSNVDFSGSFGLLLLKVKSSDYLDINYSMDSSPGTQLLPSQILVNHYRIDEQRAFRIYTKLFDTAATALPL